MAAEDGMPLLVEYVLVGQVHVFVGKLVELVGFLDLGSLGFVCLHLEPVCCILHCRGPMQA